jgi:chromosome partitioning protein
LTRTIAVANQKGGVAKTTTVASLGAAWAEMGRKVLLVDLDPQSCLTFSLGFDPEELEFSVHDVLLGRVDARMAIVSTDDGPDLLPSTIDLAGTEAHLLTKTGREYALRSAIADVADDYDIVVLDCSPSWGASTAGYGDRRPAAVQSRFAYPWGASDDVRCADKSSESGVG